MATLFAAPRRALSRLHCDTSSPIPELAPAYALWRLVSPLSTAAAQPRPAAAAPSAAAAPPPPPPSVHSLPQLRQQMEEALHRGRFADVSRLLRTCDAHLVAPAASANPVAAADLYDCALKACAASGDGDGAMRLIGAMWRRSVPVGRVAQGSAIKALCGGGRRTAALAHLKTIPGSRLSPVLFNTILAACATAADVHVGQQCWEYMQRRQIAPDVVTWCELLRLLGAAGDPAAVEALWQKTLASDLFTVQSYANGGSNSVDDAYEVGESMKCMVGAARVAALAAAGDDPAARAACEEMMNWLAHLLPVDLTLPAETETATAVQAAPASADGPISTISSGVRTPQSAAALWQQASPLEHLRAACNTALRSAEARRQWGAMRKVAALMTGRGLPPDVATYNSLLRAALRRGDGAQALQEGLWEMSALGIDPDAHTHSLLVEAHAEEGDVAGAHAAFQSMRSAGLDPPPAAWAALLKAHGRHGDLRGLADAYEQALAGGMRPSAAAFLACFDAVKAWASGGAARKAAGEAAHAHDRQLAAALVQRWAGEVHRAYRSHLHPPVSVVVGMIGAHGCVGQTAEVVALMQRRYRLVDDALRSAHSVHSGWWSVPQRQNDAALEKAILAALPDGGNNSSGGGGGSSTAKAGNGTGSAPFAASFSPAAAAPGGGGAAGEARDVFKSRGRVNRTPAGGDVWVFNAAIAACGRGGHLAAAGALLRGMKALHLPPDAHTYTALIAACGPARQPRLARQLLNRMLAAGLAPSCWTFNALLKAVCYNQGVDAAHAVIVEMRTHGLAPDAVTWASVLGAAQLQGRGDVAQQAQRELDALTRRDGGKEWEERVGEEARGEEEVSDESSLPEGAGAERHWRSYYALDDEEDW